MALPLANAGRPLRAGARRARPILPVLAGNVRQRWSLQAHSSASTTSAVEGDLGLAQEPRAPLESIGAALPKPWE